MGLVLVDAVDGEAVELEEHAHPLAVALGQVVVDGDDVDALAGQGVEVDGEGGHEGLTLAGSHLGNLAAVKHHTADELHVVVHHVPRDFVAAGHPVVLVEGAVALDGDGGVGGSEVAVAVGGGDLDGLVLRETLGRLLDDGEGLGQDIIEDLLGLVVRLLLQLVDAFVEAFLLADGHVVLRLDALAHGGQLGLLGLDGQTYLILELQRLGTQLVVAQRRDGGVHRQAGIEERLHGLHVALALVAKQFGQKICHSIYLLLYYHSIYCTEIAKKSGVQRYNFSATQAKENCTPHEKRNAKSVPNHPPPTARRLPNCRYQLGLFFVCSSSVLRLFFGRLGLRPRPIAFG